MKRIENNTIKHMIKKFTLIQDNNNMYKRSTVTTFPIVRFLQLF